MTDDQFWRLVIGGGIVGLLVVFRPQIARFLHRIGYRDWRKKK
jgi:hypothetical protein